MTTGSVNISIYDDAVAGARDLAKALEALGLTPRVTFYGLAEDRGGELVFGSSGLRVERVRGGKILVSVDGRPPEWLTVSRVERVHVCVEEG